MREGAGEQEQESNSMRRYVKAGPGEQEPGRRIMRAGEQEYNIRSRKEVGKQE